MTTTKHSSASRTASRTAAPKPTIARKSTTKRTRTKEHAAPLADIGVPNPYALAEVVARRHIDWASVSNPRALLEEIFQTPYGDLFDPANGSPLYIGQHLRADGSVVRTRPSPTKNSKPLLARDDDLQSIHNLAQLTERLGAARLADIPVRNVLAARNGLQIQLGETIAERDFRWEKMFDKGILDILFPERAGYHPDGFTWQDAGRFYNETAEFSDPVQGAVGDCYFIAALSSVAWSMPFVIADQTRATGADNELFKHQIGFHGASGLEHVEVTDRVLVNGWGGVDFCSSKEAGEIWPAVYEKAYAKWRLDEASDFPAIPSIAGGDPSIACAQITGLADYRNWHQFFSASDILQLVKNHTTNGRTTTPMIAWTYGTAAEGDQGDIAYREATVVAGHAYSVLGWLTRREFYFERFDLSGITIPQYLPTDWPVPDPGPLHFADVGSAPRFMNGSFAMSDTLAGARSRNVDYVVLRNPWGSTAGTGASVAGGGHQAIDVDWWRTIPLGADGVFAMEINAYHRYFAGTGGAH